ncbi:MAG: chemotaxis protein CheW [Hydrogenothermus sp.]|nr:MAG: chemotaxis protein CheW [Hydrogenothermus sp.]
MESNNTEMQVLGIKTVEEEIIHEERVITFRLNEELVGIDINDITKITKDVEITPVPKTKNYILGVMNLRGNIIPVVSLKKMFKLEDKEQDYDHPIVIVVETELGQIGITVDNIEGAVKISPEDIQPPPMNAIGIDPEYIKGVVMLSNELLILLDIKKIFRKEDK